MNKETIAIIVFIVWLPVIAYIGYKWFRMFNSPDGERYLKRRMQGPFVPLGAQENAEDEARKPLAREQGIF